MILGVYCDPNSEFLESFFSIAHFQYSTLLFFRVLYILYYILQIAGVFMKEGNPPPSQYLGPGVLAFTAVSLYLQVTYSFHTIFFVTLNLFFMEKSTEYPSVICLSYNYCCLIGVNGVIIIPPSKKKKRWIKPRR